MSLSVASNWLWNFGIGYASAFVSSVFRPRVLTWKNLFLAPYLVDVGHGSAGLQAKVFFIWGSTCLCCAIFTYFCIPEVGSLSSC